MIRQAKIAFVLIFLYCPTAGFSQQTTIDSLFELSSTQRDEDKVHTLISIAREYFMKGDTLSLRYSKEAIQISYSIGYESGLGQAMLFHGLGFADFQPDSALKYYIRSSEILNRLDHPWAYYGYRNSVDIYMNKSWYPEALDYIFKVFEINQQAGDTLQMLESLSSLGYLHNTIGNHNEALHWQSTALEMMGNINNHSRRGIILGRIGILYDDMGIYDSALYYNNLAVNYFRKAGNDVYVAQWLSNIANTQIKLKNYTEAENLLKEAVVINAYDDRKPNIYNNLAKVYIETGRFEEATSLLDSAFTYAVRFQMKDVQSETWFRKYELLRAQENISDALDAYISYSTLRDSILNEKKTEQIAQMLVRHETKSKEKALLFERAEKNRLENEKFLAQLSAKRRQIWIWGISFFSLLIFVMVLFFLLRLKRSAQNEKNLAIIREQEKSLIAIINAQEEERKKIAKDLHDGIGQQISAVSLNFQAMTRKLLNEFPALSGEVEKVKQIILDTSHDIRSVSHQMMPRALTQFGLVDALEDLLEMSFSNTDIAWKFTHQNMSDRLPHDVEIGLYRVSQELISNIIKHSQARNVSVQLYRTESTCVLSLSDDGIGFGTDDTKGTGLTNINSRVTALNGDFKIQSKPEKGVTATIIINI
jgi:signal transduction histidine kinase